MDIKNEVNQVEEKILQAVSNNTAVIQDLTNDIYCTNNTAHEEGQVINAATQQQGQTEMYKLMQTMQQELQQLRLKLNHQGHTPHQHQNYNPQQGQWDDGSGGQGRGNGGRGRGGRGFPKGRGTRKRNTKFYCWTHGACAHTSKFCNYPAEGHQIEATFANKMGGSTRFCNPTNNNDK